MRALDTATARAMGQKKKGKRLPRVIEREKVLNAYRERVAQSADLLFNAQMTRARGMTFLYKIEKELIIGPKGGKSYRAKRPALVTEQWEIEAYLEGKLEDHDLNDREATYYFLTTKEPDNGAIDSMLDRTFGKAPQSIELDVKRDLKVVYDPVFAESLTEPKKIIDVASRQTEDHS